MSLLQINNKIILLFLLLLVFFSEVSLSQNPLQLIPTEVAKVEMPILTKLNPQWWQYFDETKTKEELDTRTKDFNSHLVDVIKKSINAPESDKTLSVIKELFNQYKKQKFIIQNIPNDEATKLQDSYSIQDLIELNTEKNTIADLLNDNKTEIVIITENISSTKKKIDQLKVTYFTLEDELSKNQIGLEWIDKRIRQALDDLRLARHTNKSESLIYKIQILEELINQASEKLVLNKSKPVLEEPEKLREKKAKIQLKIDELNLKLAQDFADTNDAKIKFDINKLDLTLASIESTKYDLLLNKNAQIVFLEKILDVGSIDIEKLRSLIKDSSNLLKQIDEDLEDWQKISQSTLLQPSLKPSGKPTKKQLKLDNLKRDKAQKITTESENIRILKNDNLFNLNLLRINLNEVETGFSKAWNSVKDFSNSSITVIKDLIYNPLFTINEYPVTLLPLIKLLLIILIGYLVSKIVNYIITGYEKKHKIDKTRNRSSLYLMHRLAHYLILFIVIMTGLSTLGINLGNITLIAGALSVGIGFGLQNLVSNFVSGLTIMIEKTLSVGDYIELEDGTTGVIKEIRARSTRLNTNDNIDVIIPNSDMVTNKIVNWTLKESIRRIKIPFGVAYGTDKELVKKAAIEAAENVEYSLTNMAGKEPDVRMDEFADNSVNYILIVWVAHYGLRRPNRMKSHYLWELDTSLNKYGIEIPFPQRDVHLNIVNPKDKVDINNIITSD